MKIIGKVWFTPQNQSIGIVLVDNGYEKKAYIGTGHGHNEEDDTNTIAKFGTPFPVKTAMELCGVRE